VCSFLTAVLLVTVVTACSTGRSSNPIFDQGPPPRHDIGPPGPIPDPDTGAQVLDGGPAADHGSTAGCAKKCTDQAEFLCVEDPATSLCVDCLTDAHCAQNPGATGAICDTEENFCVCSADTDCAGKVMGSKCHGINKVCSCVTNADCTGGRLCIGNFFGSKYCRFPCTSNADCASELFLKVCDPTYGCMECVKSTDCGPSSLGNSCESGLCVCETDDDCASNVNGRKCLESELCGCASDFDCPTGTACVGQYLGNTLCK
jgi:hypothetical protein